MHEAQSGPKADFTPDFTAELIDVITQDEERTNSIAGLLPKIESTDTVINQLKATAASPPFQQALTSFTLALQTGQMGPIVAQFDVNTESVEAADIGDLELFVRAMEKEARLEAKLKQEKLDNDNKSTK